MRWDGTNIPTVLTIHNIAYQGNFDASQRHLLAIPDAAFDINGVEFHGRVSFLKAGGFYASHVTTVSPTYATEITTETQGAGLHGLMEDRAAKGQLSGIVNGIDESWDPGSDPHLPHHFDPDDLNGKQANAEAVRTGLCLRPSEGPLFGIVSRLVHQKGLDLVAEAANDIVENGGQIAILGLGDPEIEHMLSRTSRRHRDDIGVLIGFNEPMARRIVAGSDFTLMPSRFEPCGLTQMQAQRYGALPIAHATGGLADTIDDGTTGFLFSTLSSDGLMEACHRAFDAYEDEAQLAECAARRWHDALAGPRAAAEYEALYRRLIGPRLRRTAPRPAAIAAAATRWLQPTGHAAARPNCMASARWIGPFGDASVPARLAPCRLRSLAADNSCVPHWCGTLAGPGQSVCRPALAPDCRALMRRKATKRACLQSVCAPREVRSAACGGAA